MQEQLNHHCCCVYVYMCTCSKTYKAVVRGQQHLIAKVTHATPLHVSSVTQLVSPCLGHSSQHSTGQKRTAASPKMCTPCTRQPVPYSLLHTTQPDPFLSVPVTLDRLAYHQHRAAVVPNHSQTNTHSQVCEEVLRWAMSTPNQVGPLAEVIKMHNRLSMDALTYKVRGVGV